MSPDGTLTDAPMERPTLKLVLRRVGVSMLIACIIPATLFYVCMVSVNAWFAIVVALGWSYGAIAFRSLTGRRPSGLLILASVVMTVRTVIALAAHSTFLYFLQPIITDTMVATAFLLSLATARPVVARLAGDFYPMSQELALRPRIQRLFWHLTLMWAFFVIGKASMTLWLLHSQSLQTFVVAKSISGLTFNALGIAVTIGVAMVVARKEGLMRPHLTELAEPIPVLVAA